MVPTGPRSTSSIPSSSRRSAPFLLLLASLLLLLLLLLPVMSSSAAAAAPSPSSDPDEDEYYWDVQESTDLWNYIESRRWDRAKSRSLSHPDEASVLVMRRERGRKGGKVTEKSLPLHEAFEVDVTDDPKSLDLPPEDGVVPEMPPEQMELIEVLVRKHPDAARVTNARGQLPLHVAAASSVSPPPSVIKLLIDAYPAALTKTDGDGKMPLHVACSAPLSSFELIKTLADADPDTIKTAVEKDQSLPIHLASWAGGRRTTDTARAIEFLHASHPEGLRITDGDGDTPLLVMVKYGRTSPEALEYVLRSDPDGPSRVGADGGTALHGALTGPGHAMTAEVVRMLLGVGPDLVKVANKKGRLPIHSALDHCCASAEVVSELIDAYPEGLEAEDRRGDLPLHHACREGVDDPSVVRLLLESHPFSVQVTARDGSLPLHLALGAYAGRSPPDGSGVRPMDTVIVTLIDAYPGAAALPDPRTGSLPLHLAVRTHRPPPVIHGLVDAYPEAVRLPVVGLKGGGGAMHELAASRDEYDPGDAGAAARALLDHHPEGAEVTDDGGRLPIHVVCIKGEHRPRSRRRERERERGGAPAASDVTSQDAILRELLLSHPEGAAAKDGDGNLPLHHAASAHYTSAVLALLDAYPEGASAASDSAGLLPIHLACGAARPKYERYEGGDAVDVIVRALLRVAPETAASPDGDGDTALHAVCRSMSLSEHLSDGAVAALVSNHPPAVRRRDGEGDLPLHGALRNRNHDAAESTALIRALLDEYPGAAYERDRYGNLPLHIALSHSRGGSDAGTTQARIARALFESNPEAASQVDNSGRSPANRLGRIVGETIGTSRDVRAWAELMRDVVESYPEALTETDGHGKTPLHALCMSLGDAASHAAESGAVEMKVRDEVRGLFRYLLTSAPGALSVKDNDGNRPRHYVENDRRRGVTGHDRGPMSGTLTALKEEVMRGARYWRGVKEMGEDAEKEEL